MSRQRMFTRDEQYGIKQQAAARFDDIVLHYSRQGGFDPDIHYTHEGFTCRCPLHHGHGQNFKWNAGMQSWGCFSKCSLTGTVIDFLMKKRNIDFGEAITELAAFLGIGGADVKVVIPAPVQRNPVVLSPMSEQELRWFRGSHQSWRRVKPETQAHMEGGYCNTPWHILYGRLTFPVRNPEGELIGVTGRIATPLPPNDAREGVVERWETAKYLHFGPSKMKNGHPCGGFPKSRVLLHYHIAKLYPQLPLIVAEGPFDVAKVWEHGYPAVVAIQGGDVSKEQWETLMRVHSHLIYALDPDTFRHKVPPRRVFSGGEPLTPAERDLVKLLRERVDPETHYLAETDEELMTVTGMEFGELQRMLASLRDKGSIDGKYHRFMRTAHSLKAHVSTMRLPEGVDLGDSTAEQFQYALHRALNG